MYTEYDELFRILPPLCFYHFLFFQLLCFRVMVRRPKTLATLACNKPNQFIAKKLTLIPPIPRISCAATFPLFIAWLSQACATVVQKLENAHNRSSL